MKKIAILSLLGLLALAVPAQATTEYVPAPPPPHKPTPHNRKRRTDASPMRSATTPPARW